MQQSDFLRQVPELGLTHLELASSCACPGSTKPNTAGFATTAEEMTAAEKYSKHAHGQFQASTDRRLSKPKARLI